MEQKERDIYNAALAHEAYVGADTAKEKPFRSLPQAEKDKFAAVAKAVLAGTSGAGDDSLLNAAPNAHALPTVDPSTGERLRYTTAPGFSDQEVAARAGLLQADGGSDTSGIVPNDGDKAVARKK